MKTINWVLQKNLIDEKTLCGLKEAILHDNAEFKEVYVVPFSDDLPFALDKDKNNVLYGTTSLIMNAVRNRDYKDSVFYDDDRFQMKVYLDRWNTKMLNYDSRIVKIGDFIKEQHNGEEEFFIRPNEDTKSFTGLVTTFSEFKEMAQNALGGTPYFQQDSLILVGRPKRIEKEWRNFIVDGRVVSSSRYCVDRQRSIDSRDRPDDMIGFSEKCCKEFMPS
ncbi:MAG TPA: ATP-grasp domain-containing protein, partial [Clostridia bacterium]